MGRTKPSAGLPPASFRKDARAKKARATINKVIPSLLPSHPRTRDGIARSEMFTPESFPPPPPSTTTPKPLRITLRTTTTLAAAYDLLAFSNSNSTSNSTTTSTTTKSKSKAKVKENVKVAILNMASPLSPGGGFLSGASSQEEYLCMHTTLLPALRDEFYRLPELSAVFTRDALVFRADGHHQGLQGGGQGESHSGKKKKKKKNSEEDIILPKSARWYTDIVTAAMLRQPEVQLQDDEEVYANEADRDLVRRKMRLVMLVFGKVARAKKVVLGAWGCGAYGNPVDEVARAWRDVLTGVREGWEDVEEVVFAVKERGMADRFAEAFGESLLREDDPLEEEDDGNDDDDDDDDDDEENESGNGELGDKIRELEMAMETARSPQLKEGLARAVAGLKEQMRNNGEED